jgi:hypothetical protein
LSGGTIFLLTIAAASLNAQRFIGGQVRLNMLNENENFVTNSQDRTIDRTVAGFSISPKGGYYLNERFAIGLGFNIGYAFNEIKDDVTLIIPESFRSSKSKQQDINFGVYPFVRYTAYTYKRFSLLFEGRIGAGGTYSFWQIEDDNPKDGLTALTSLLLA